MTIYIALLRGINVGGKNIIKMAELKKALEEINLYEVKTYIQSGNVLFKSDESEKDLKTKIEHEIKEKFGISVAVVLRTAEELEKIILCLPFSNEEVTEAEAINETESLYVALLTDIPLLDKIDILKPYKSENDDYRIIGREVFLLLRHSISKSKLANNLQKLDIPVTVRNWKTINKLAALVKSMEI